MTVAPSEPSFEQATPSNQPLQLQRGELTLLTFRSEFSRLIDSHSQVKRYSKYGPSLFIIENKYPAYRTWDVCHCSWSEKMNRYNGTWEHSERLLHTFGTPPWSWFLTQQLGGHNQLQKNCRVLPWLASGWGQHVPQQMHLFTEVRSSSSAYGQAPLF